MWTLSTNGRLATQAFRPKLKLGNTISHVHNGDTSPTHAHHRTTTSGWRKVSRAETERESARGRARERERAAVGEREGESSEGKQHINIPLIQRVTNELAKQRARESYTHGISFRIACKLLLALRWCDGGEKPHTRIPPNDGFRRWFKAKREGRRRRAERNIYVLCIHSFDLCAFVVNK